MRTVHEEPLSPLSPESDGGRRGSKYREKKNRERKASKICLPQEMDPELSRKNLSEDSSSEGVVRGMKASKERARGNMDRLQNLLARTSFLDEPDSPTSPLSPASPMVNRKSRGLTKYASVPDFQADSRVMSVSVASASQAGGARKRGSFVDQAEIQAAKRFTQNGQSSGGDIGKWLNGEMISRRQEESSLGAGQSAHSMSLRQLMKVDDRINASNLKDKRYFQDEQADQDDLRPVRAGTLRHGKSYRSTKTVE